jgi:threonine/homoserine/homoserine lactone efflux protein
MVQYIQLFFAGLLISFLGQLPLGNMNMTATLLHVQESAKNAWKYGIGLALVEVVYLRLALTSMDWVLQHKWLFNLLGWVTMAIFFILGIASFMAARKQVADKKGLLLDNKLDRFLLGLSISALNPVQIPFWFTWSMYVIREKLMTPGNLQYNTFTIGAGIGTLAGLAIYIHGGKWIVEKLKANNKGINKFMGIVFIIVALLQLYKMIFDPWTENT